MLTYMQARKIAEKEMTKITKAIEEKDAYIFIDETQKWDGELVVMKEDGKVLSYSEYVINYNI